MHERACWEWFFFKFGALRPSKTSFSLERGAKNHMFTKFSLFFRIIPKVPKKLSKWVSKSPQNTLKYTTQKWSRFLLNFFTFLTPKSGPKWCLRAPLGVSWELSGRAWPHIVPPSASQGCPRDSPGTPKTSISTYSRRVFDHRAQHFGTFFEMSARISVALDTVTRPGGGRRSAPLDKIFC